MTNPDRSARMKKAGEESASKTSDATASGTSGCPSPSREWVEIELLGVGDAPIRDEVCLVVDSEGRKVRGKTNAKGLLRLEGLAQGECTVSFPQLDADAWGTEPEEEGGRG